MSVNVRVLWTVCAAASVAVLLPAWLWSARAHAESERQRSRADRLAAVAREVQELSSGLPEWTRRPRPGGSLSARVSAAIAAAGLPPAILTSLTADNEQPTSINAAAGRRAAAGGAAGAGAMVRRSRATVVLGSITLPQFGTLAQQWQERDPAWTISSIEATPQLSAATNAQLAQTGGDMPLRVVVVLESVYVDNPELLN